MSGERAWAEQDCPDDAPDGTCWTCGADKREPHVASCRTLIGTDAYDGAPLNGGVTDPAATSGPNEPPTFPAYRTLPIAACPECLGDCVFEGADGWYCPACKHTWTFQQVAYFEDRERDD